MTANLRAEKEKFFLLLFFLQTFHLCKLSLCRLPALSECYHFTAVHNTFSFIFLPDPSEALMPVFDTPLPQALLFRPQVYSNWRILAVIAVNTN